ncbi:beta-glucosidase [Leifsonia sp. NPDC058194]|uniref:beta-glucosidase family protein n=1 Tax=Leifsonia sp. NPDC058194 TaxID=3346374 RepID=UPI0036DBAF24
MSSTTRPRGRTLNALVVAAVLAATGALVPTLATADPSAAATAGRPAFTPSARVSGLINQMTLDEKLSFVTPSKDPLNPGAVTSGSAAYLPGVPRLAIPPMRYTDGSAGLRLPIDATAYPVSTMVGSTFDPDLAQTFGSTYGTEARAANQDVLLAPMVSLIRVPQGGRNYEAFGEDPLLVSRMAAGEVSGIQDAGVIATIKHFALNNQETNKGNVSANISEQAFHETELEGFAAGVKAGAGAAMCAYNKVNGVYSCSSDELLNQILKTQLDFQGYIMSDWGVTRAVTDMNAGLDQEMYWVGIQAAKFTTGLRTALTDGTVPMSALNDSVGRILTSMEAVGLLDGAAATRPTFDLATGAAMAQKIAEEGGVLLKNNGALPLTAGHTISVFGPGSVTPKVSGVLSAEVKSPNAKSPLQAITERAGAGATVTSVPAIPTTPTALQAAGTAAAASDIAIVFVADTISTDRAISLTTQQNDLINTVATANPNTIVVLNAGSAVTMPWLDKVAGVLDMYYPGVNGAQATAALLYGDVNPSGKLSQTFPVSDTQTPFAGNTAMYPGVGNVVDYSEGVNVGYRGYQAKNITPLFPFGYGLSYTSFSYSAPTVVQHGDTVTAKVTVTNTGTRAGKEVPQVYAGASPTVTAQQAQRKLVGFDKIELAAGESKVVEIPLDMHQFEYWDSTSHSWKLGTGVRQFWIGSSSANLPLTASADVSHFDVSATTTVKPLAGKAYLSVAATNNATTSVDIVITTAYGNKTFTAVEPGTTVSVSINSKLATVPAGSASVAVTGKVNGASLTETKSAPYAAYPTS